MPDGGDATALYGVVVADVEVAGEARKVTEAASAVTGAGWVGIGAGGAGAITVGEGVPFAVTTVLSRPVLEPPL